jgi:hypothetical protein
LLDRSGRRDRDIDVADSGDHRQHG